VSYVSLMVHVDADRELGGRIGTISVFLAEEALINSGPNGAQLAGHEIYAGSQRAAVLQGRAVHRRCAR
jgi:hypothetical protein